MTISSPQLSAVRPDPWWIVIQHPAHVPLPLNSETGSWAKSVDKAGDDKSQS